MRIIKIVKEQKRGMLLLLMVVLLAAFLSIALGIANILLGQIFIVGQAGESFRAFYASDVGRERTLYLDTVADICGASPSSCGTGGSFVSLPDGSCYKVDFTLVENPPYTRHVAIKGKNSCASSRYIIREFAVDL